VVWFKQTINNACGMYAVLHALSNGSCRRFLGEWAPVVLGPSSSDLARSAMRLMQLYYRTKFPPCPAPSRMHPP
jgi:ubiquitin carboxyl-terminal hydrolase L3